MNKSNKPHLRRSSYNREACHIGIVHLGPGAFHRAHQAYYVDEMMEHGGDLGWGIAAINLRASESESLNQLKNAADGYVLKTAGSSGAAEYRLIRSQIAFADWSTDAAQAEDFIALKSVKIISITVTESGYYLDERMNLNPSDPVIQSEIEGANKASVYAYLRAGLHKRVAQHGAPISILCCDNLRGNGRLVETNFKAYLALCHDQPLLDWLAKHASFPGSMVDRITPRPGNLLFNEVAGLFDREDDPCVLTEDFNQWVLEDNFAGTRPPLEQAGVQMVKSVEPFEETKIRVLNGGHTCLAYLGALRGLQTCDQAITDAKIRQHFSDYEEQEVLPALPDDLPFDKQAYLAIITARFENPHVADSLQRICMDGVSKFAIFILPTIVETFRQGRIPRHGITSIASWYVFAKRIHEGLMDFDYVESNTAILEPLLAAGKPLEFASSPQLWGNLVQDYPEFSVMVCEQIDILDQAYPVMD